MTWTKLSDTFYDSPKILAAGNEAAGLYTRALSYCGRHNTDGRIPEPQARSLGRSRAIQRLCEVGLWEQQGDHYFIPDYLDFNPSKAEIEGRRKTERERLRKKRGG